jgi:predicted DNA-binding transcriptional regulator AlpA
MGNPLDRLLTSTEVAEILNVPVRSLDAWAYRRTGPPFARVGRFRRYRPSDVAEWLAAQADGRGPGPIARGLKPARTRG